VQLANSAHGRTGSACTVARRGEEEIEGGGRWSGEELAGGGRESTSNE